MAGAYGKGPSQQPLPHAHVLHQQSRSQLTNHQSKGPSGNPSGKNSYQNTRTSNFGLKPSQSNQDVPKMEVRGNTLGHNNALNRSTLTKFVNFNNPNKTTQSRSQAAHQNGSKGHVAPAVVLSKHKSSKNKEKQPPVSQTQMKAKAPLAYPVEQFSTQ